jgi:ATP-dependent 26S proteasome regulatory subunit
MDGFEENNQIIVVGATNLLGNLDPALLRPGRFDRIIEIKLPDPHERFKILKIHLRGK